MAGVCPRFVLLVVAVLALAPAGFAQRIELVWPTPNRAWVENRPQEDFLQPTVSGEVTSGRYGCVRSNGLRFHEGLDLKPVARDRKGEPTDPVFAAMSGVVRHINTRAGNSSYGNYIVLDHPDVRPAIYTLYAHVKSVAPGLRVGDRVKAGQTLGMMGRTAGGYSIPKDRAHLHFEMGLRLSDSFDGWYLWKKFGSPNKHGVWNGMNLAGFDPLDFFNRYRAREVAGFAQYLARQEAAVVVRVARGGTPDFAHRYPELVAGGAAAVLPAGWEMRISATGTPLSLKPLGDADLAGYRRNEVRVVEADETLRAANRGVQLVKRTAKGGYTPDDDLLRTVQLVFGVR